MPCIYLNSYIYKPPVPPLSEVLLTNDTTNGQSNMISTQEINFRDSGGVGGPYSSNEEYAYTFNNTSGNGFEIDVGNFSFEEFSSSQYDRLGIIESNDNITFNNVTVSWLQTSSTSTCPWSSSFGGSSWNSISSYNGYIFPSNNYRATSSPLNWDGSNIVINKPYIKFCFFSDGSSQFPGWDLKIIAS